MWENILVTGLILNFGCNNTLLSEGHNMVSSQENSGSNTLYKNKLHLWIWMTTFGRSTKSWCLRSPQLHQQDKKYSERVIFSKLRRMLLGTGQCNLIMVLKQLEGFLLATHYCRNTAMSQKDDRPFSLKIMHEIGEHGKLLSFLRHHDVFFQWTKSRSSTNENCTSVVEVLNF